MYDAEALLDIHDRVQRSFRKLLGHCRGLDQEEVNRELAGFGYPTVRLQLNHVIAAEEYWVGVLRGLMLADDNEAQFPTIESLEGYRDRVSSVTREYLHAASPGELNTARRMTTWRKKEQMLVPAHVILRTQTHAYHHQGQVVAMCRLLGKPAGGLDFPIV